MPLSFTRYLPRFSRAAPPRRHLPIAAKMAVLITAILVAGMSILAVIVVGNQQRLIRSHIEEFGRLLSYQLAVSATEPLFTDGHYELAALLKRYVESPRVLGAVIYDNDNRVVAAAGIYPPAQLLPNGEEAREVETSAMVNGAPLKLEPRAIVLVEPISFRGTTAGHAALVLSRQALDYAQREIIRISLLVLLVLSVAIGLVAIYLGRRLARPLHSLVDAARLLERGEFIQIPEWRSDEFGQIIRSLNSMGQGLVRIAQVEDIMRRVLDRDVANKLLDEIEPVKVGGDRVDATVLFADIVGFTTLSERMSPEAVSEFLNDYFFYLDACSRFYFGSVDKFIGDAVMVVFGAPLPNADHQYHAVACAVLMQRLIAVVNERRQQLQLPVAQLRIGINSGQMLAGMIGSQLRMDYTVVGDAVNLASRLCSEAEAGQIVVEEKLYLELSAQRTLRAGAPRQIKLRGKSASINLYTIEDIEHSHPMMLEQLIEDLIQQRAHP
jgi:adenylate cyclase